MYRLFIVACILSILHGSLSQTFDETTYNPCQTQAGLYFYPHPLDIHKYYQCDDNGNAFPRSCGDLVWDALRLSCNWASAVVFPSSTTTTVTVPPTFTTTRRTTITWPIPTQTLPTIRPITTVTTTTRTTTSFVTLPETLPTIRPSLTTTTFEPETLPTILPPSTTPPSSLCNPVNPCGDHGVCVESIGTIPKSAQRFACICSDNWFGRLCDRQITELTTPPPFSSDQNQTISRENQTFNFPIRTGKDSHLVFYGLRASKPIPLFNQTFIN